MKAWKTLSLSLAAVAVLAAIVVFSLFNCPEFVLLWLAAQRLGAIAAPILALRATNSLPSRSPVENGRSKTSTIACTLALTSSFDPASAATRLMPWQFALLEPIA